MRQLWNFANQLTIFRLLIIPAVLIAILYDRHGYALALFLIASATDAFDGLVARWLKQRTALGAYLDPIADKLLLSSTFFILALIHSVPWWVTILVLSRDVIILITSLVVVLFTSIRRFPPSVLGKLNTGVQVATVLMVMLRNAYLNATTALLASTLVWLAAASTIVSGVQYAIYMSRRFDRNV